MAGRQNHWAGRLGKKAWLIRAFEHHQEMDRLAAREARVARPPPTVLVPGTRRIVDIPELLRIADQLLEDRSELQSEWESISSGLPESLLELQQRRGGQKGKKGKRKKGKRRLAA